MHSRITINLQTRYWIIQNRQTHIVYKKCCFYYKKLNKDTEVCSFITHMRIWWTPHTISLFYYITKPYLYLVPPYALFYSRTASIKWFHFVSKALTVPKHLELTPPWVGYWAPPNCGIPWGKGFQNWRFSLPLKNRRMKSKHRYVK